MVPYYGSVWLIAVCSSVIAQTEVPARVVTLLDENSYVDYKPVLWNYTEDGSQLILPIRFRTRSIKGRLITLSAEGTQSTIFTLNAYIDNAAVVVDLHDGEGKLIKKTERQLPGANNGEEHSMSVHLNPEFKILKVVYGQGTVDSYDFTDDIKTENEMQLNIRTGGTESTVGCVSIVGLTIGSRFVFELEELKRSGAVRDGCDTLCLDGQCNKGVCIDLFHSAVCDCRDTYQSGERCDEAMKTLNLSWDQYISYKISENESQPAVISVDFKTEVKEGLIIHGTILSLENDEPLGNLKLALIYGQLRLTIANLAEINFDNVTLNNDRFNRILLEFDYGLDMVHMTFNGNTKSASLNSDEKENHIRFGNELFFSAGDSEVGLSGCLGGIYVGHFDVIDEYTKGSSKVNASAGLKDCDGKDLVAGIGTINLPILVREEEIQEKPLDEITEEHEKHEHEHEPEPEPEHELDHDREQEHEQENEQESDNVHEHANKSNFAIQPEQEDERDKQIQEDERDKQIQEDERDKQIQQEQARLKAEEDMQAAIGDAVMMKIIAGSPPKQLCENDEATSCQNSIECVKQGTTPVCVCRKGFVGKHCQFSLLPWNCDEVLHEGNTVPGTYIIDPDGSGPLPQTYAYCERGETIIPHNMPNRTLIHSKELGDIHMIVNYKLLNDELLQSLKNRSETCKQTARYDCRSAPLQFTSMKTWFTSIPNIYFLGFGGSDGSCPCEGTKCKKCNCDDGGIEVDYGVVEGDHAPIRNIYSLNDPTDNKGYLTLGPLVCSGSAGRSEEYTMKIREQFKPVAIGSWSGNSLSFDFRTYLENATLLSSNDGKIEITMVGRTLHLLFDNQINLVLIPQSSGWDDEFLFRKNDGYWHRIIVDIRDGSVRFSVDDTVDTAEIQPPSFTKTDLNIGGGGSGFLGCVRQIIIDGELKNVNDRQLTGSCANKCEFHDCKHASHCEEDFATDSLRCVCQNDIIHSGEFCQNSINNGTEISFHDAKRAYLKAQNPTDENALKQRIVFSFRTDQRDALLIYLHDQLYNFVQVHLVDHSHMVLMLNYNRTIRRCEVVAKVGHEFSRMHWIQVMILLFPDSSELYVDDEICQISGPRILSTDFIKKYNVSSDIDDVIEPPVSPVTIESGGHSHPYVLLFVGGVPTENYLGSLDPIYRSSIPNLLGCMRGLLIGTQLLDMRKQNSWIHYPIEQDMIRLGCQTGCTKIDSLCKNGGHCAVQWTAKYIEEDATCNCARTSYYGEYCSQDSGVYFAGHSMLVFSSGEIFDKVIFDWSQIGEQRFSFAFSTTTGANDLKPQTLAAIYFEHNRMMEIVLCKNGSLNVGVTSKDSSYVYTFPYSYDDGYRHYFQSRFRPNKPLRVTVDSWKYSFPAEVAGRLSLAYASKFVFGGSEATNDSVEKSADKKGTQYNYTGCISNIDIDMSVARMHFKPILYLQKPELEFAQSAAVLGDELQLGACNSFLIPGSLPPVLNIVQSPVWDSPFVVEPFTRKPPDMVDAEESEGKSWWIILLIILLILLIILIIFGICYYMKKKKQESTPPPDPGHKGDGNKGHENIPLLPTDEDKKPPFVIKDDFVLPEPDQHLDEIHVQRVAITRKTGDRHPVTPLAPEVVVSQPAYGSTASIVSGLSGLTAYFTANTSFDSDEDEDLARAPQAFDDDNSLEDTLMDYEEDETLIPNREDVHTFDRSAPERMSSFKRGDPTAPPDSPLYKAEASVTRKPKPVPPPRSPIV